MLNAPIWVSVLFVACGGSGDETTASPSATDSPAPTFVVTGIPASIGVTDEAFEQFRVFTRQIDRAVRTGDSRFFANLGIEYVTVCQERDRVPECIGQPAGTRFEGIYAFDGLSGEVQLMSRDNFTSMLDDWWAKALPTESDKHGTGEARVVGIARVDGHEAHAVVSLISQVDGATERQARIFRFIRIYDQQWALHAERFLPTSELVDPWLSGNCPSCYDYWEPWEGAGG